MILTDVLTLGARVPRLAHPIRWIENEAEIEIEIEVASATSPQSALIAPIESCSFVLLICLKEIFIILIRVKRSNWNAKLLHNYAISI